MKLTDAQVRNLKPQAERYEIWEANGFGVRVTPKGNQSFVFLYRFQGKPRRLTLGTYPAMTLAEAHKAHAGICAKNSINQELTALPSRTGSEIS